MENRAEITTLKSYFADLRNIVPPAGEVENDEIIAAQRGDREARNDIICKNLRLVVAIAKKYKTNSMALEDIIQEGNFGLFKAIDSFDVSLGYKFSTYATYWVRQAIGRAIANKSRAIRIPVRQLDKISKYKKAYKAFVDLNGREPSCHEMAIYLNITETESANLYSYSFNLMSLDEEVTSDDEGNHVLGDFIEDNHADFTPSAMLEDYARKELIDSLLKTLKPQEADVISKRFGLNGGTPMTLEQIGNTCHLTRERIRQVEAAAMRKLRNPSRTKLVEEFLA